MKNEYQILLFYKYVFIENPEAVRDWQRSLCEKYGFKGRLIVAKEGINFTLEGKTEDTESYITELQSDPHSADSTSSLQAGSGQARFQNIHFKKSPGTGNAFPRLSVKVRPEIVSLGLGVCDIDPNQTTGIHLSPDELHQWIASGRQFYIIDMRNAYEHDIGQFAGSICPPMKNFRELPAFIESLSHLKNKTVLTVCTGGVRCEKASGYLITQGFTDVYQLDGGIVSYMEKYPNEDFEGKLYVFDGRVAMGFYTDDPKHKVIGKCVSCGSASENITDCREHGCNGQFILCDTCEQKQISKRGHTHCVKNCSYKKSSLISKFWNKLFK